MYEGRWRYSSPFGLPAAVAVLLLALFAALPLLILVFDTSARNFFFNKEGKDFIFGCLFLLGYEAVFELMAYVLYCRTVKNWIKSFTRPDCFEIGKQGIYHKYQDEEMCAEWSDIVCVLSMPTYRFKRKVYDLMVVLQDGTTRYIPLSELARPLESLALVLMLFIGPFAGAFGFKKLALSIGLFFFFVLFANNRRNHSIAEQIEFAAQYYQELSLKHRKYQK